VDLCHDPAAYPGQDVGDTAPGTLEDAIADAEPNQDVGVAHSHVHTYADGHRHAYADGHRHTYADGHTHAYADGHVHAYADGHKHACGYFACANGHRHTYADGHRHAYVDDPAVSGTDDACADAA